MGMGRWLWHAVLALALASLLAAQARPAAGPGGASPPPASTLQLPLSSQGHWPAEPGTAELRARLDLPALCASLGATGEPFALPEADSGPQPLPGGLPVPEPERPQATLKEDGDAPPADEPAAGDGQPALSATLALSFPALGDDNTVVPPDTHGAAGPDHLLTMLNSQVRVQSRSGVPLCTVSLGRFWAGANPGGARVFDPRVLYDPLGGRFILSAASDARSPGSAVLLGVSDGDNPLGGWTLYRIAADPAGLAWADFPSTGFNQRWIAVQANAYVVGGAGFSHSLVLAFDKADLYAGGPGRHTRFAAAGVGGTQWPATTYDDEPDLYFAQSWNGSHHGQGVLRLYALRGPLGAETFGPTAFAASSSPWADSALDSHLGQQLGSPHNIQVNDSRIRSAVVRGGYLWAAQGVLLPAASPSHAAAQWWQLEPDSGRVVQRGLLADPSGRASYAFPSLAVNSRGDMLIGYSRFSPDSYASAGFAYRAAEDAPGSLRPEALLKAGEAPYFKAFAGSNNRWGDYSATLVDPRNDLDFWTIQEYAALPAAGWDRWGTWWGHIVLGDAAEAGAGGGRLWLPLVHGPP
jgi:hypothetical protein